jgi:hypothetical protein
MGSLKHPATIIATLALLVALAGTGFASDLVSGSQIRNAKHHRRQAGKRHRDRHEDRDPHHGTEQPLGVGAERARADRVRP